MRKFQLETCRLYSEICGIPQLPLENVRLKSKWHLNTRQTVGCGILSSLLTLWVDLHGLCSKRS